MKNENKKSSFKRIIIICLITIIVILIALSNLKTKSEENTNIVEKQERPNEYVRLSTVHSIDEERFFNKYDGNVSKSNIIDKITKFIYYFIDNKTILDVSEDEIKEKYEESKSSLNGLGITTLQDYEKIIKHINNSTNTELELSYTEFIVDSIKSTEESTIVDFNIKFVDLEILKCQIEIVNNTENQLIIRVY